MSGDIYTERLPMKKIWKKARWILPGMWVFGLEGCATSQQWFDFVRTEFARLTADSIGQLFTIYVQAVT
jgi:hypothetical protein